MTLTHVVWLTVALPLAGFLANGALALWRPQAKSLVSVVGAGTLLGAFAVSAGCWSPSLIANVGVRSAVRSRSAMPHRRTEGSAAMPARNRSASVCSCAVIST